MPRTPKQKDANTNHNSATSVEAKLKYAMDSGDAAIEQKTIGTRKGCVLSLQSVTQVTNATLTNH